jgi:hypothetical protein
VDTEVGDDEVNTRAESLSPLFGEVSHERENMRHRVRSRVSGSGNGKNADVEQSKGGPEQ